MYLPESAQKFKEQWDHFFETAKKPCDCIFCKGSRICWNGHRERTASVLIGDGVTYLIDIRCRRVKCGNPECKKSWTIRPSGLMPRRHYQLCVVASAASKFLFDPHTTLTLIADAYHCSRRTLVRWLNWIAGIAEPADLLHRLSHVSKETAATLVLKMSGLKKSFKRAAENLCILEALGMAHGYESSGLRCVVETAIFNRDRITTYHRPFIPELAR